MALLGKPIAIALLLTISMPVTSSSSSELIAVSSILTIYVYKLYIKPHGSPKEIISISHIMICVFGAVMGLFACIWNLIGIDLSWLFLVMGLLIGGAVFPAAFAVTWRKQSKWGAIPGAIGGLAAGLIAWLTMAKSYYGEVMVATTGSSYPTLAGNMAGVLTGLILTIVVSYIKPDDFDWEVNRSINLPGTTPTLATDSPSGDETPPTGSEDGKRSPQALCPIIIALSQKSLMKKMKL